jgi:transposase
MGKSKLLYLSEENRSVLEEIYKRDPNWRIRERAQTLLLLDDKFSRIEVAEHVGINLRTVGTTMNEWLKNGIYSLSDRPRYGAPSKINSEERAFLKKAATEEPLSAKDLLKKHIDNGGKKVHSNTIMNAIKSLGFVFKRTRHSLEKKRDEESFCLARGEIEEMLTQTSEKTVIAYLDESGFSQIHPNRGAWTPKEERHLIKAVRGKRLNVMAALLSTDELFSRQYWETTDADIFLSFMKDLKAHVGDDVTLVVILDNASIHKAKSIRKDLSVLEKQDVLFYFLPAYCPELNRIERLWHMMKYNWLQVKHRTEQMLFDDIKNILDKFGTIFKFPFYSK